MTTLQSSSQKQLRQLVESIERLEEEKKALSGDIRDKYLEAKGLGFDVKILRQVVRLRKKSQAERQEEESVLEVYLHALGMLGDGGAADRRGGRADDRRRVTAGLLHGISGERSEAPRSIRRSAEALTTG